VTTVKMNSIVRRGNNNDFVPAISLFLKTNLRISTFIIIIISIRVTNIK